MMIMKEAQTGYGAHTTTHIQGIWFLLPGVKFLESEAEYMTHLVLKMLNGWTINLPQYDRV